MFDRFCLWLYHFGMMKVIIGATIFFFGVLALVAFIDYLLINRKAVQKIIRRFKEDCEPLEEYDDWMDEEQYKWEKRSRLR